MTSLYANKRFPFKSGYAIRMLKNRNEQPEFQRDSLKRIKSGAALFHLNGPLHTTYGIRFALSVRRLRGTYLETFLFCYAFFVIRSCLKKTKKLWT